MANNATVNGISVATDEIGNVHHQKIKIEYGKEDEVEQVSQYAGLPVTDAVATAFDHGSNTINSASPTQLASTHKAVKGVIVKAASTNGGRIFIGNNDVTADTVASTDGLELAAGESVFIPISDVNKVYLIADIVGQKVFYLVV